MTEKCYSIWGDKIKYRVMHGIYKYTEKGICRIISVSNKPSYHQLDPSISKSSLVFGEEYEFELTRIRNYKIDVPGYRKKIGNSGYLGIPIVKFERIK